MQGVAAIAIGVITCWWMIDFPERSDSSFCFLSKEEAERAVRRVQNDRGDVQPAPFTIANALKHFLDPRIYRSAAMFFLLTIVSTALSYFLPIMYA